MVDIPYIFSYPILKPYIHIFHLESRSDEKMVVIYPDIRRGLYPPKETFP
jgi:hypothetical protein